MNLLKKNPAQIVLVLVALCALGTAVMLIGKIRALPEEYVYNPAPPSTKVEKTDLSIIAKAHEDFTHPAKWIAVPASGQKLGSLFVSHKYMIKDGQMIRPDAADGEPLHPPISNAWVDKYGLDLTLGDLPELDTDSDGFTTLDEWNGLDGVSHLDRAGKTASDPVTGKTLPDDSTDPTDAKSHPSYLTKLVLVEVRKKPFRMKFMSWDGDPQHMEDMTFQLNTIDVPQPTLFLKIGQAIPRTRFKITGFVSKTNQGPNGDDLSELLLQNLETNAELKLVLGKETDSPDSFAIFNYKWVAPGGTPTPGFAVQFNREFGLEPEKETKYKLIDIKDTEVQIHTPAGENLTFHKAK
jgi:hypothetical protein